MGLPLILIRFPPISNRRLITEVGLKPTYHASA
jgi:hypothetical protein